ncbi:MAG: electron transport protein SCO1/SenC [Pedosphaera sp.]|nr:electron transport protein SCO1/SenC [Pedosphaera sp.]
MNKPARSVEWLVWGGLVLIIAVIGTVFVSSELGPGGKPLPVIGQIPNFNLTNQNNEVVSLASLRGQVWVADIIFSRCPGPCAKMTRHFAELQAALPHGEPVRLVTFTSDPEYDSPAVLKKYSERFGADGSRWWFLTGNKPQIRSLAVNDFKFVVVDKDPKDRTVPDDLFIHSTWFALVDKQGRVRGWMDREGHEHAIFDSEDPDMQAQLLAAIKQLLHEPSL